MLLQKSHVLDSQIYQIFKFRFKKANLGIDLSFSSDFFQHIFPRHLGFVGKKTLKWLFSARKAPLIHRVVRPSTFEVEKGVNFLEEMDPRKRFHKMIHGVAKSDQKIQNLKKT